MNNVNGIYNIWNILIYSTINETNYSNMYQDKLRLVKENSDNYEASFGFRY